jgi:hypothetical protein
MAKPDASSIGNAFRSGTTNLTEIADIMDLISSPPRRRALVNLHCISTARWAAVLRT